MLQDAPTLKEQIIGFIRGHSFVTLKELSSHFQQRDPDLYLKHIVDALAELAQEDLIETRIDQNNHMESIIAPKDLMPDPDC